MGWFDEANGPQPRQHADPDHGPNQRAEDKLDRDKRDEQQPHRLRPVVQAE